MGSLGHDHQNFLPYIEALSIVNQVAEKNARIFSESTDSIEAISLIHALDRVTACDIHSPVSTPLYDTSAMDGYAVNSDVVKNASRESPILLKICGTMAAGDIPFIVKDDGFSCSEIMTGARFPEGPLDAVVPIEDTIRIDSTIVQFSKPVMKNQHRRFAGSDFHAHEKVVVKDTILRPQHIMALASLSLATIAVKRRLKVGLWSTGTEIINGMTADVNGPYLIAVLQSLRIDVAFLGVVPDNVEAFVASVKDGLKTRFDLFISTGAVSVGKFDFVQQALENLDANIHFHHVAMRPGHPILFASVRNIPFFGLPGNPIAAACCFQFLVLPYLNTMRGLTTANIKAKVASDKKVACFVPAHLDSFRHGSLRMTDEGHEIRINIQQSPAKVKPVLSANCWVHLPNGRSEVQTGDFVECFAFDTSLGFVPG